jgi:adenosine deaminase
VRAFADGGVAFTIATDGPEMMQTHLRDELALLLRIGGLGPDEVAQVNARGHSAAFVRPRA